MPPRLTVTSAPSSTGIWTAVPSGAWMSLAPLFERIVSRAECGPGCAAADAGANHQAATAAAPTAAPRSTVLRSTDGSPPAGPSSRDLSVCELIATLPLLTVFGSCWRHGLGPARDVGISSGWPLEDGQQPRGPDDVLNQQCRHPDDHRNHRPQPPADPTGQQGGDEQCQPCGLGRRRQREGLLVHRPAGVVEAVVTL